MNMKLVIILAVLSLAFANPTLLGTEKCTYGPAYWCESLKTSQECTAIKHCLVNDWKRMKVNVQANTQCELCQHSVLQGRELQQNGVSKEEITSFIESFCSKVDEKIQNECLAVTSGSMTEIIQMLESELSPEIMCHLLEMCHEAGDKDKPVSDGLIHVPLHKNEQYKPLIALTPAKLTHPVTDVAVGNKTWCTDCKNFFNDIINIIGSNKTEQEFEELLDNFVCDGLGPLGKTCKKLVHVVAPMIQKYIAHGLDANKECETIGMCPGSQMPARFMQMMTQKRSTCNDCMAFFKDIQAMITSGEMETKIANFIEQNVCGALGPLAETCKGLVKSLLPYTLDILSSYVNATQDCQVLGFCTVSAPLNVRFNLLQLRHLMIEKPNAAECDVCHVMVTELKTMIEDPKTQKKIMTFVETEICGLFKSEKEACIKLMEQYGPEFIKTIVTELDPVTLCKALGLCPADVPVAIIEIPETKPIPDNVPAANEHHDHKLSASTQCILCEFVMRELQTMLKDNSTEQEIIAALDEVCSVLPSSLKDQCVAFIAQYGKVILELLEQELDPKSICTMIGLCQAEERIHKHVVAGHGSIFTSEQCTMCQTIIQYVYTLLKENSTEQEIKDVLEKVCNFLPSSMQAQCDAAVEEYTETIIVLITQMASPLEICQAISMCAKPKVDTALLFQPRLRIVQNNDNNFN